MVKFKHWRLRNEQDKKTDERFFEYINTYRLVDSVNDGATLQILYEGQNGKQRIE